MGWGYILARIACMRGVLMIKKARFETGMH